MTDHTTAVVCQFEAQQQFIKMHEQITNNSLSPPNSRKNIAEIILRGTINRRKQSWFGYACRHDTLPKMILQGTMDGRRRRGKSWKDNTNQ